MKKLIYVGSPLWLYFFFSIRPDSVQLGWIFQDPRPSYVVPWIILSLLSEVFFYFIFLAWKDRKNIRW